MGAMWLILLASLTADDGETVHKMLRVRLMSMQNVMADFDKQTIYNPSPKLAKAIEAKNRVKTRGGATLILRTGEVFEKGKFSFFDGLARIETSGESTGTRITAILNDRTESSVQEPHSLSPRGVISDAQPVRNFDAIDYALGLRLFGSDEWLAAVQFDRAETSIVDGIVTVTLKDANVPLRIHTWTIDPEMSYALLRYQVLYRENSSKVGESETDASADRIVAEVQNGDFTTVDGLVLPRSINWYSYRRDGDGHPIATTTVKLKVTKYTLGADGNNRDSIQIKWPLGSNVVDARTATAVKVESMPQVLTDQVLAEASAAAGVGARSIGGLGLRPDKKERSKSISLLVVVNVVFAIVIIAWFVVRRRFMR